MRRIQVTLQRDAHLVRAKRRNRSTSLGVGIGALDNKCPNPSFLRQKVAREPEGGHGDGARAGAGPHGDCPEMGLGSSGRGAPFGNANVEGWDRPEVEITFIKSMERYYEPSQQQKAASAVVERRSDSELAISTILPRKRFARLLGGKGVLMRGTGATLDKLIGIPGIFGRKGRPDG